MKIYDFLNAIISRITGKRIRDDNNSLLELAEDTEIQNIESFEEDSSEDLEERINAAKRTLITKLYMLEQEIAVFKVDFPSEYQNFLQRIEELRNSYNSSLEELKKLLTFEIDPESDTSKIDEVIRLERDIKKFIQTTVKFHIISNRLQRLIRKLNILYNVSILHSKECEKEKVRMQLENAIQAQRKLAKDLNTCDYILSDKQLKDRIIELLSYVDYEIFKISMRSSKQLPEALIGKLVMLEEFDGFDYVTTFIAYIKDELSDLLELLPQVSDIEHHKLLKSKSEKLLVTLTCSSEFEKILLDVNFWSDFFSFESTLIEILKINGASTENTKVKVIDRMDVKVDENDVLILPISNAKVSLVSIFAATHDERILILIKILENLSKNITYREIYFLILLFDGLEVIQNTPNDLIDHIEKYIYKYPYSKQTIMEKKKYLLSSSNKEYVFMFYLDTDLEEIIRTLGNLSIDFKVESGRLFINSFYFNGLQNVLSNLKTNTNNI